MTESSTPHDKVILPLMLHKEPVTFSHCVHLELGHRFHALLKVCSDRDDIVLLTVKVRPNKEPVKVSCHNGQIAIISRFCHVLFTRTIYCWPHLAGGRALCVLMIELVHVCIIALSLKRDVWISETTLIPSLFLNELVWDFCHSCHNSLTNSAPESSGWLN